MSRPQPIFKCALIIIPAIVAGVLLFPWWGIYGEAAIIRYALLATAGTTGAFMIFKRFGLTAALLASVAFLLSPAVLWSAAVLPLRVMLPSLSLFVAFALGWEGVWKRGAAALLTIAGVMGIIACYITQAYPRGVFGAMAVIYNLGGGIQYIIMGMPAVFAALPALAATGERPNKTDLFLSAGVAALTMVIAFLAEPAAATYLDYAARFTPALAPSAVILAAASTRWGRAERLIACAMLGVFSLGAFIFAGVAAKIIPFPDALVEGGPAFLGFNR